jgi:hypothetical protein
MPRGGVSFRIASLITPVLKGGFVVLFAVFAPSQPRPYITENLCNLTRTFVITDIPRTADCTGTLENGRVKGAHCDAHLLAKLRQ